MGDEPIARPLLAQYTKTEKRRHTYMPRTAQCLIDPRPYAPWTARAVGSTCRFIYLFI